MSGACWNKRCPALMSLTCIIDFGMRNTGSGSVPGLESVRSQDPVQGHFQGPVRRVSPLLNRKSSRLTFRLGVSFSGWGVAGVLYYINNYRILFIFWWHIQLGLYNRLYYLEKKKEKKNEKWLFTCIKCFWAKVVKKNEIDGNVVDDWLLTAIVKVFCYCRKNFISKYNLILYNWVINKSIPQCVPVNILKCFLQYILCWC